MKKITFIVLERGKIVRCLVRPKRFRDMISKTVKSIRPVIRFQKASELMRQRNLLRNSAISMVFLFFIVLLCVPAFASGVIFLTWTNQKSSTETELEMGCRFYGLDLKTLRINSETKEEDVLSFIRQNPPEAVIVTAEAMANYRIWNTLEGMRTKKGEPLPVLIAEVNSAIQSTTLRQLSNDAILECRRIKGVPRKGTFMVEDFKPVARQIGGQKYETNFITAEFLTCVTSDQVQVIICAKPKGNQEGLPVFVLIRYKGRDIFFLSSFKVLQNLKRNSSPLFQGNLLEALPFLMFLRYACGERCWEGPRYYANLTIDDPWLREPYGYVRFGALLEQMEKDNFHTTFSFIPWNFDRSETKVIELFRNHPDRFSICQHGNNHDHREFNVSEKVSGAPGNKNSANVLEAKIVQGVARMDAFTRITGLPYDRVMIFPHAIGGEETLVSLKKINFLATINQDNIPQGARPPEDFVFYLRNFSLDYGNFASVWRSSVKGISEPDIALELFLDNPVLLYGHHDLFKNGPDQFNHVARMINRLEPSIRWVNLGTIARRLYLTRTREDGGQDILAFCRCIELENPRNQTIKYFIFKRDSFSLPIRRVNVDGEPYPWEKTSTGLSMTINIPAGCSRKIEIIYEDGTDWASVDLSKKDPSVNRLRNLSDFRDVTLSRNFVGRIIVAIYYDSGAYQLGMKKLILIALVLLAFFVISARIFFRWYRKTRA